MKDRIMPLWVKTAVLIVFSWLGFVWINESFQFRSHELAPTTPTVATTKHMKVTAYCPCSKCCSRWADGITASGKPVTFNGGRFVAADRTIPFGTLVTVPGYADGEPVPVLDRGGAISGDRIDVFFPSHDEALEWGVRWLDVQMGVER